MSEFQIYDFRRVDNPLGTEERKIVQGLSSHIDVSSRRAVVSYSYGDFKHDSEKVVEEHFDALLHQTSWGQRKLVFRFPKDSVDYKKLGEYDIDAGDLTGYSTEIRVWKSKEYVMINIEYCDEDYEEWLDESSSLDGLLQLRTDLMNNDYSCLYAFWLKILNMKQEYDDDDDNDKWMLPALPYGLAKKPSAALQSFIDLYDIDENLIKAAATFISSKPTKSVDYEALIKKMSESDKNDWLQRVIEGEALLDIKLKRNLAGEDTNEKPKKITFEAIFKALK